jgi:SAM-dependent methyltransferase
VEANVSLSNLVECDKATCLEELEKATDSQLWDNFLEGQAKLFFDSEFIWIAKGVWWQGAKNILEIGSGNGAYLYRLSRQFYDKTFKGIEKLSQPVKQANEQYAGTNLVFQEGDAEIFDDQLMGSADIILFRLTLQHLTDPAAALQNAAQYLSSNGYVLIIDACDTAKRTSHPIHAVEESLQLVAEIQKKEGKGNRKATLELLQTLETEKSPLSELYEVVSSNLDKHGNIVIDSVRLEGEQNRTLCFNHSLFFLNLLHRTYHIPVDLSGAYDELRDYLADENAWNSPGMHFLVLKKKI